MLAIARELYQTPAPGDATGAALQSASPCERFAGLVSARPARRRASRADAFARRASVSEKEPDMPTCTRAPITATIVAAALMLFTGPGRAAAADPDLTLTVVNVEYEGTKIWLPSPLIAKKGQRVRINLINKVPTDPNQHGFAIAAFGVSAVVTRGEPQTVEFVAERAGLFPITCQLHPAHVGGQLLVVE
jgi:nitrosocyanin